MKAATLIIIAALAGILVAATYPSGAKAFGYSVVPEGVGFTIDDFTYSNNSTAYAIASGGEVYSILLPNFSSINPIPLTDREKLIFALRQYYSQRNHGELSRQDFESAHEKILNISQARASGESECRRLMGTDRFECTSFETCRLACFATPFCPNFAYGGSPGEFIYVMKSFEDSSRALTGAYAVEGSEYARLAGGFSYENAVKYAASVSALEAAAKNASNSTILGYSFCHPPDYGRSDLSALNNLLGNSVRGAAPYYLAPNYSEVVRNRTIMALEKKDELRLPQKVSHSSAPVPTADSAAKPEAQAANKEKSIVPSSIAAPSTALAAAVSLTGWLLIAYASLSLRAGKNKSSGQAAAKK
ncbi:MAG: hypothetical protein NTV88_00420 [Candidatus Micrarchaeota archaeon]|nr:hypothetical protein [Candidatus Micrarchaeota archaeon]